jgi:hypothetical protein
MVSMTGAIVSIRGKVGPGPSCNQEPVYKGTFYLGGDWMYATNR